MTPKPLWDAAATPPVPDGWRLLASLVPRNRDVSPQSVGLLDNGRIVSTQGDADDNTTLTWYSHDGKDRLDEFKITRGGHGDRTRVRGNLLGLYVGGVWCEVPQQSGSSSVSSVQGRYRASYTRPAFAAQSWFQGEIADADGVVVRLYGVPFREYGPSIVDGETRPNIPTKLVYYRGTKAYHSEDLRALGRDAKGTPLDDRLEPEGLGLGEWEGTRTIYVGIVNGRSGHSGFTHRVYGRRWSGPPN